MYLLRRGAGAFDRALGLGGAGILMLGAVLSGSRGGFLALIAVGLYGLFRLSAVRASKRIGITVAAAAVLLAFGGQSYWERMRSILKPQEDYNWAGQSESGRIEVWRRGIGYMLANPLFGVGVDQFGVAEGTMAPEAQRQQFGLGFKWSAAHSSYVQIGAEIGAFGLLSFVAMLWFAFREARRIGRTALAPEDRLLGQAFGALVVGFAVGGAFLSQAFSTYLYFALGLLIAFARVVPRGGARGMPVPQQTTSTAPATLPRGERGGLRRTR
jgi:O-antigen ligase